jgi:hypothetical protein
MTLRWLRRWIFCRWVFLALLLIYGILFVYIHNYLAISTLNNVQLLPLEIVKVQVQSPKFQKKQQQNNTVKVLVQLPAPSDWNNSLVEGQVEYYLTSGMDLWDHSTILPDWMKRECGLWMEVSSFTCRY